MAGGTHFGEPTAFEQQVLAELSEIRTALTPIVLPEALLEETEGPFDLRRERAIVEGWWHDIHEHMRSHGCDHSFSEAIDPGPFRTLDVT